MRVILFVLMIFLISSCVTMTDEAKSVMVHAQVSNLLDACQRLGSVAANSKSYGSRDNALVQAKNDLRDKAYREFGADTVAIINVDNFRDSVTVQGIAFKCD